MKLAPGMLVKTSYGTGPYRIKKIYRNKTMHLTVTRPDGTGVFYLNNYDEETLSCLGNDDRVEILPNDQSIQLTLF